MDLLKTGMGFLANPTGALAEAGKNLVNPENMEAGTIEAITGLLGTSILHDPHKEATDALKNPGVKRSFWQTIIYGFKKYVATWGILLGILAEGTSMITGRIQKSSENPSKWLSTISWAAQLAAPACLIGSIYGQYSGAADKVANIDPTIFLRSKGNEIIDKFGFAKTRGENDLKAARDKTIELGSHGNEDIQRTIKSVSSNPVKSVIFGPEGSGKADLADKIADSISTFEENNPNTDEKRKVVVERFNCSEIVNALLEDPTQSKYLPLVSAALKKAKLPGLKSLTGPQLIDAVIYGIQQRIDNAKNQRKERLVVELIDVHRLWSLAITKEGLNVALISKIENALCDLLNKDNKYDIVITSDFLGDKTFGLDTLYGAVLKELKQDNVGKKLYECVKALSESINIPEPDDIIKAQVIVSAIFKKNVQDDETRDRAGAVCDAIKRSFEIKLNEICEKHKSDVRQLYKEGKGFYKEERYAADITKHYIDKAKFESLTHGDISSVMSLMSSDEIEKIKQALLSYNAENQLLAVKPLVNKLIEKAQHIDSSRDDIKQQVQRKTGEMSTDKAKIELEIDTTKQNNIARENKIKYLEREYTELINVMLREDQEKLEERLKHQVRGRSIIEMIEDFRSLGDINDSALFEIPIIIQFKQLRKRIH